MTVNLTSPINRLLLILLIAAFLYLGKPVLVPLCFGALLAMLFLPLVKKLESLNIPRAVAAIICVILFLTIVSGVIALLGWQISELAKDLTNIKQTITETLDKVHKTVSETFGISAKKQDELIEKQQSGGGGGAGAAAGSFVSSVAGTLLDTILVLVYTFLLLFFRKHLVEFALRIVPAEERKNTQGMIYEAGAVAQKYLSGLAIMIGSLWILYSIGFSIVGLNNPFLFAILCGTLEIIPFVGNLAGTSIAVIMGLIQGGETGLILGIVATYAIVQFLQTYVLETLIVGDSVNLNPLFTIITLVVGELIWGIPGMVLAIPLTGIFKIICDRIPALNDIGFLIGPEAKPADAKRSKKKN